MQSDRGMALISSILMLALLTLVGGALLTTATIDVTVADNYRTNTKLLFLAEMGIEEGREALRVSANDISTNLAGAAGLDATLSTSRDLTTLLGEDDQPWFPTDSGERTSGRAYVDPTGRTLGTYHVFLRNDAVDGVTSTTDTNDIVNLLSIARIGNATRIIEVEVKRGDFPNLNSALTLDGPVDTIEAAGSNVFHIDGTDGCGGSGGHAVGVISDDDVDQIVDEIPEQRQDNYTGVDPFPDIEDIGDLLPGHLTTVAGLEELAESIATNATDLYEPDFGDEASIGDVGSSSDRHVVVVNGDATFGPGSGYGILLIRGVATFDGNFYWNGLVLIVGQGEFHWNGGGQGEIVGGMFVAKTRDAATADEPLGPMRSTRGDIIADFNGGGGNGVYYDACTLENAYDGLPFTPIAIREY